MGSRGFAGGPALERASSDPARLGGVPVVHEDVPARGG